MCYYKGKEKREKSMCYYKGKEKREKSMCYYKGKEKREKSMCYYKGKIHVASDLNFLCESLCLFHSNDKSHGFFPFLFSLFS